MGAVVWQWVAILGPLTGGGGPISPVDLKEW